MDIIRAIFAPQKQIAGAGKWHNYRIMTYDECRVLSSGQAVFWYSEHTDMVHRMKITSVKTWKRSPKIVVHWKYGLYEYGEVAMYPDIKQGSELGGFVQEIVDRGETTPLMDGRVL